MKTAKAAPAKIVRMGRLLPDEDSNLTFIQFAEDAEVPKKWDGGSSQNPTGPRPSLEIHRMIDVNARRPRAVRHPTHSARERIGVPEGHPAGALRDTALRYRSTLRPIRRAVLGCWGGFAPGARLPSPGYEIILGKMMLQG